MFPSPPAAAAAAPPTGLPPGTNGEGPWRRPAARGMPATDSLLPNDAAGVPLDATPAARRTIGKTAGLESEASAKAGGNAPEASSFATILALQQHPQAQPPQALLEADAALPTNPVAAGTDDEQGEENKVAEKQGESGPVGAPAPFSPPVAAHGATAATLALLGSAFTPAPAAALFTPAPAASVTGNTKNDGHGRTVSAPTPISGSEAQTGVVDTATPVAIVRTSVTPAQVEPEGRAPTFAVPQENQARPNDDGPIPFVAAAPGRPAFAPRTLAPLPFGGVVSFPATPTFTGNNSRAEQGVAGARALPAVSGLLTNAAPRRAENVPAPVVPATFGAAKTGTASFAGLEDVTEETRPAVASDMTPVAAARNTTFDAASAPRSVGDAAARERVLSLTVATPRDAVSSLPAVAVLTPQRTEVRQAAARPAGENGTAFVAASRNEETDATAGVVPAPSEVEPAPAEFNAAASPISRPQQYGDGDAAVAVVPVGTPLAAAGATSPSSSGNGDVRAGFPAPATETLVTDANSSFSAPPVSANAPAQVNVAPPAGQAAASFVAPTNRPGEASAQPAVLTRDAVADGRRPARVDRPAARPGTSPAPVRGGVAADALPEDDAAAALVTASPNDGLPESKPEVSPAPAALDNAAAPVAPSSSVVASLAAPTVDGGSVERRSEAVVAPVQSYLRDQMPVPDAAAEGGRHRITLRLNPDSLGEVRVRIETAPGGVVRAALIATTPEAQAALEKAGDSLRRTLEERGLRVRELSVRLDASIAATTAAGFVEPGGAASGAGQQQPREQNFTGGGSSANPAGDAATFFSGNNGGGRHGAAPFPYQTGGRTINAGDESPRAAILPAPAVRQLRGAAGVNLLA